MFFRNKCKSRKGQNILEYSLLFVIIMVAVYMMGDYVKHSWNAQVKTFEDSANHAARENIPQPNY